MSDIQIGMKAGYFRGDLTAWVRDAVQKPYTRMQIEPHIVIDRSVVLTDVSFWQGDIDFDVMRQAGAEGVIIRAGQNLWKDAKFDQNYARAKAANLARGSYWFYDSRVEPVRQAQLWASILNNDYGELDHAADWEENYGGAYGGWVNLYKFITEFQMKTGLSDERVPIYTGYYYWLSAGKSPQGIPESMAWFKRHPLWLGWYTSNPDFVKIPSPWDQASLLRWQYTASGNGALYGVGSAEIDLNNHNGDKTHYLAHYGLGGAVPPVGGAMEQWEIIWQYGAQLRTGPAFSYSIAPLADSVLKLGQVVNVQAHKVNVQGSDEWAQHENGYWFATIYNGLPRAKYVTPNPPAVNVADMPFTIVLGGGASPYVETVVSGVVKAK